MTLIIISITYVQVRGGSKAVTEIMGVAALATAAAVALATPASNNNCKAR